MTAIAILLLLACAGNCRALADSRKTNSAGLADILDFSGNSQAAVDFILDKNNAAVFIVRVLVKYIFTAVFLVGLTLVLWGDGRDLRESEEFNLEDMALRLTDPESSTTFIYVTAGMTSTIILCWFLPTLLWRGDPDEYQSQHNYGQKEEEEDNHSNEGMIMQAIRRNFTPNGVALTLMIDTVVLVGQLIFWTVAALYSEMLRPRQRGSGHPPGTYYNKPPVYGPWESVEEPHHSQHQGPQNRMDSFIYQLNRKSSELGIL